MNANRMRVLTVSMSAYRPMWPPFFYCTVFTYDIMIADTRPALPLMRTIDFISGKIVVRRISRMMKNNRIRLFACMQKVVCID